MSKEFEDWYASIDIIPGGTKEQMLYAWEAARKDHYRIGEEVEARLAEGCLWEKCRVKAGPTDWATQAGENVRRVPEWEPKEGEAVFALYEDGNIAIAKMKGRSGEFAELLFQGGLTGGWEYSKLKPFSAEKIGKPWDEI